jgi:hypothetical protein
MTIPRHWLRLSTLLLLIWWGWCGYEYRLRAQAIEVADQAAADVGPDTSEQRIAEIEASQFAAYRARVAIIELAFGVPAGIGLLATAGRWIVRGARG